MHETDSGTTKARKKQQLPILSLRACVPCSASFVSLVFYPLWCLEYQVKSRRVRSSRSLASQLLFCGWHRTSTNRKNPLLDDRFKARKSKGEKKQKKRKRRKEKKERSRVEKKASEAPQADVRGRHPGKPEEREKKKKKKPIILYLLFSFLSFPLLFSPFLGCLFAYFLLFLPFSLAFGRDAEVCVSVRVGCCI